MSETTKARHQASKAAEQAEGAFDGVKDRLSDYADDLKKKGKDFYDDTRSQIDDSIDDAQTYGKGLLKDAQSWIKKNPGLAVGGALVAGMLISTILSNRNDD